MFDSHGCRCFVFWLQCVDRATSKRREEALPVAPIPTVLGVRPSNEGVKTEDHQHVGNSGHRSCASSHDHVGVVQGKVCKQSLCKPSQS